MIEVAQKPPFKGGFFISENSMFRVFKVVSPSENL